MLVTVLLGSNMGDKADLLVAARRCLAEQGGREIAVSHVYETEPWGFACDEPFYNQAATYDTALTPEAFLRVAMDIERQLGRTRPAMPHYTARTMDIDLLFCDSRVIHTPDLSIPHPRMAERRFALEPLAEIMPDFVHPIFQKSIRQLLQNCSDTLKVEIKSKF